VPEEGVASAPGVVVYSTRQVMGRVVARLTILIATILWIGGASAQTLDIDRMSKEDLNKLAPE
jgi:hypothetical protein